MSLIATPTKRRYATILPSEADEITLSPEIRQIIRRKVSSYLGAKIESTSAKRLSKMVTSNVVKNTKSTLVR